MEGLQFGDDQDHPMDDEEVANEIAHLGINNNVNNENEPPLDNEPLLDNQQVNFLQQVNNNGLRVNQFPLIQQLQRHMEHPANNLPLKNDQPQAGNQLPARNQLLRNQPLRHLPPGNQARGNQPRGNQLQGNRPLKNQPRGNHPSGNQLGNNGLGPIRGTQAPENRAQPYDRNVPAGNNVRPRGNRGSNQAKREYYRQKNNPYNQALDNVASYMVKMALNTAKEVAQKHAEKRMMKEQENSED